MSSGHPKPVLKLDWCDYKAARYAVEHWHYSRCMPAGKLVKVGVWEDGAFVGCVVFGRGAIYNIGRPYGLEQTGVCELVRVALTGHTAFTSRVVSIAVRFLHRQSPGLRLIVSYADSGQGHHGGIYQASGWLYVGSESYDWKRVNGEIVHPRSLYSRYGTHDLQWLKEHVDPSALAVQTLPKHKYLMPLDGAMRIQIAPLAKPYPKRPCATSIGSDAPATHAGDGGAIPTVALS